MTTYISILRGINVGGRRKILMADLKVLYQKLGFTNVITYIQSGNVIFEAKKNLSIQEIEEAIKLAIQKKYDYDVPVLVKTVESIKNAVKINPFLKEENVVIERLYLTFLAEKPSAERLEHIKTIDTEKDSYKIIDKDVFIYLSGKFSDSKLTNNFFETKLKVKATTRNWKTVLKLIEIASS